MKVFLKFLIATTILFSHSLAHAQHSASSLETIEISTEELTEAEKKLPTFEDTEVIEPKNTPPPEEEQETEVEARLEPELSQEELERYEKFVQADQLYLSGDLVAAEKLYRELKQPFEAELRQETEQKLQPIYDPSLLDPAGAVYWKLYQQGLESDKFKSKRLVPLKLLVEQHPQFIPGYIHYAQVLENQDQEEEALQILQEALVRYPHEAELLKAKIEEDQEQRRWLEASITARQFAMFNPDHPQVESFNQLAEENLDRYRGELESDLTWKAIANVVTGGASYALTGNFYGPLSALETIMMLVQGESSTGDSFAEAVRRQLPMLKDKEVVNYVREIGYELADVAGRDEFEYEFYVVMQEQINAFALPGGKIFINAGAILETNSEAELAGLLAHELAHAVLSHGFQLVAQGNLTANIVLFIPYVGNTAANLLILNYSREMETEADFLGTKILTASGYAADGVRNLMVKIEEQHEKQPAPPAWLSTHPDTKDRVAYLEELIVNNDLNRYAYEGVERHWQIKQKVRQLLSEYQEKQKQPEQPEQPEQPKK